MEENKVYLGDSVYASFDGGRTVCLTTENGYGASNTIFLEADVFYALKRFWENTYENDPE